MRQSSFRGMEISLALLEHKVSDEVEQTLLQFPNTFHCAPYLSEL